jgi:FixJ family two-component response regulator
MARSGRRGGTHHQPSSGEPPLVAIVDDDASMRQSSCRLVRSFGYRAEAFASGDEFLRSPRLAEAACLLLDVRMPGVDGLEVQRLLAERGADIPIVFLTGRATDDEERRARAAGAVDFLRKPVRSDALLQAFRRALQAPRRVRENRNDD